MLFEKSVVDWGTLRSQYVGQVSNLTRDSSGKNETLSAVVQVASLALTAVAVALAPWAQ